MAKRYIQRKKEMPQHEPIIPKREMTSRKKPRINTGHMRNFSQSEFDCSEK
jgi:hypothetical protein